MTRPTITRSKFPMLPFEQSLLEKYGGVGWLLNDVVGNSYCNVINTAVALGRNLCIDGDMETAGVTAWGVVSSATLTKQGSAHGGTQCLRVAYNGVASPGAQQAILQTGRAYTITGWYRGDGASGFPIFIQSGGVSTGTTSNTWQSFTVTLIAISTTIQLRDGFNGTGYAEFDDITITELNIPAYNAIPIQILNTDVWNGAGVVAWTAGNSATLSAQTTTRHDGISGTVLRVARNTTNSPQAQQLLRLTIGQPTRIFGWLRSDGTSLPRIQDATLTYFTGTASTDWQPFDFIVIPQSTTFMFVATNTSGTQYSEFDVTVVALDTGIRTDSPGLDLNMEALVDSGTASAGASTTLTDASKTWVVNVHAARLLTIVSGTGAGQTRAITSNTSTVITTAAWTVNPDNTSVYQIISYWVLGNNATITKDTSSPHSGSRNLRIARSTTTNPFAIQVCLVTGKRYRLSGWYKTDGTATVSIFLGTNASALNLGATITWTFFDIVAFANNANLGFQAITSTGTQYAEFDDVTVTEVSPLVGIPVNSPTLGNTEVSRLLKSASFNKVNNLINLYSAQLRAIFPTDEGTVILFCLYTGSWTDGIARYLFQFAVDSNNNIAIVKNTPNNVLITRYVAGGITQSVSPATSTAAWFSVAITWSKANDRVIAYLNGAQSGSTQTGLGQWVGNLASNQAVLAAITTAAGNPWGGSLTHCFILNAALSASEISEWSSLGDVS